MTLSVDTSQPLFPAIPVIFQWAHGQVAMMAGVGVMPGLSNMDTYSPRPTWLWPLLSAQSTSKWDWHWAIPRGGQPGLIYFHYGRAAFCSYWNGQWIWICLPCMQYFCPNYICGLTECLIFCHGIPRSVTSDQRTHFITKEGWQWAHAYGIHWSYHVLHYSKAPT